MKTIEYLYHEVEEILEENYGKKVEVTIETIGRFLCGESWELAKHPFKMQFLEHVAYNGPRSFKLVMYLQLDKLQSIQNIL
jgi:hypothetical protein